MSNDTRPCYYPNHKEAPNNVPCSSDEYTHCCGENDICLTNGYCLGVNHQPWVLSRGACTNQKWDSGCPAYCASETDQADNPSGGCSIVNLEYANDDGDATYCCGTPVSDNGKVVCPSNADSFTLDDAHAIPGYALLSNASNFYVSGSAPSSSASPIPSAAPSTNTGNSGTNHDVTIGAGVGVPLGVIALASLAWAFFERKRARTMSSHMSTLAAANGGTQQPSGELYAVPQKSYVPAELEHTNPAVEIMGRER